MIRVRFAPSPTGMFHVGGARSALFNWALAEQSGGRFVLRIEDTDAARNRPEWTEGILSALAWIGISGDNPVFEGPHFQSENESQHREAVAKLLADGKAYYCDCTRELLQERTGSEHKGYDGFCRDRALSAGAVRFRTPDEGVTVVDDVIRGRVEFPNDAQEDFVIARSDGSPLYVLANAVDDITQGITHVVRGEEHLANAQRQQLLWPALGANPPVWAHLPVIVNEQRKKLSKRRDKVALESYRDEGYLAEAMVNYLMLLGWGPGEDREIMPWAEMVPLFRLEDVNSANAFFDEKKLRAFNGEYIRALPPEEFAARCEPWLDPSWDRELFARVAPLAQTRIAVLSEITANVDFLFLDEPVFDQASWDKAMKNSPEEILSGYLARLETADMDPESLKTALEEVGAEHGLKLGKAQAPVRVAVTGRTVGLPLFESIEALGRERSIERVRAALTRLRG
ncbi:glutamate--tRNA ligase [Planomonospora parontospora subsp. parontospora]|uniref:Glutamate--tRNA ligase n=2 Tax=Planomonospora parontospora TaxID=58119 RepID=A0AA37F2R7_9ACTN|nr:glutamate--tRNA ligase [Planomonospora parontospora]GGK51065.1 glutamate--tRNA ligase [Planomonospora parontospora]GII07046.1 glutamate--tRNA ligase [Planomonospora parontospora subsp. parontospora]